MTSITTAEFKKRFGKKPVDEVAAEDRYKDCLKRFKPKLAAGVGRKEKLAADRLKELHALVGAKDWHGAADLLEEIAPKIAVNPTEAEKQRKALAAEVERACPGGRALPPGLQGAKKAAEAAILEDDHDDAADQIADFKALVDQHLQDIAEWGKKTQQLDGRLKEVAARRVAEGVKMPPLEEGMANQSLRELQASVFSSDFVAAEKQRKSLQDQIAALLKEPADQSPEGLKALYDKNLPGAKKAATAWRTVAKDANWAALKSPIAKLASDFDAAEDAYGDGEYAKAWAHLDSVVRAAGQLDVAGKATFDELVAALDLVAVRRPLQDKTVPVTDVTKTLDLDALEKADSAAFSASMQKDWAKAVGALTPLKGDFAKLAAEIKKQPAPGTAPAVAPAQPAPPSPKVAEYEQKLAGTPKQADVLALLTAPDFDPAAFRAAKGATKLLDDMVGALGGKAKNKASRQFVQEAMKARFGLTEVSGGDDGKGMSSKALPRMYQLFARLPASHTTDNDLITSLERQKAHDTSWHSGNDKKIVLKAGKTGKAGGEFDETTLHEIAHGVDMKLGFMKSNGSARKFGGWQAETKASVMAVAGEQLGFYKHFDGRVPKELLEKYMDVVLSGGNPKTLQAQFKDGNDAAFAYPATLKADPGVQHADGGRKAVKDDTDQQRDLMFAARKKIKARDPGKKAILTSIVDLVAYNKTPDEAIKTVLASVKFDGTSPKDEDWAEMAVHPAVDFAANAGLKNGSNGLWDQGDGGASRCAFGGRVYQEAYAGNWVSYLLAARGIKVSNYQFRHQMEWFAEVYAKYFTRKLSSSHPLYPWLQEQEGKNTAAVPS